MLEIMFILSVFYAITLMPLRGKSFQQLSPKQQANVTKKRDGYLRTRKGQQTPNMSVEEYLPIIQKQGLTFLILAIVLIPVYIAVLFLLYAPMFAG